MLFRSSGGPGGIHIPRSTPELLDVEAVGGHVWVFGIPVTSSLLDHQVGVAVAEDSLDVHGLGELEAMCESFVFCYVVGCREMDLQHIVYPASLGRGEDDSGA